VRVGGWVCVCACGWVCMCVLSRRSAQAFRWRWRHVSTFVTTHERTRIHILTHPSIPAGAVDPGRVHASGGRGRQRDGRLLQLEAQREVRACVSCVCLSVCVCVCLCVWFLQGSMLRVVDQKRITSAPTDADAVPCPTCGHTGISTATRRGPTRLSRSDEALTTIRTLT
jgi:hypothetical protein